MHQFVCLVYAIVERHPSTSCFQFCLLFWLPLCPAKYSTRIGNMESHAHTYTHTHIYIHIHIPFRELSIFFLSGKCIYILTNKFRLENRGWRASNNTTRNGKDSKTHSLSHSIPTSARARREKQTNEQTNKRTNENKKKKKQSKKKKTKSNTLAVQPQSHGLDSRVYIIKTNTHTHEICQLLPFSNGALYKHTHLQKARRSRRAQATRTVE